VTKYISAFSLILIFQIFAAYHCEAQSKYDEIDDIYEKYRTEISSDEFSNNLVVDHFLSNLPSKSIISKKEIKDVLRLLVYLEKSDLEIKAINLLEMLIPKLVDSPLFQAYAHHRLGLLYYTKENQLIPALENALMASHLYEEEKHNYALISIYNLLARINVSGQNFEQSLTYSNQAYNLLAENPPRNREDSILLRSIIDYTGLSQRRLNRHLEAINSFDKSVELSLQLGDSVVAAIAKGNKAVSYFELGKLDLALSLLLEDYNISKRNKIDGSAFNAGIFIGLIYKKQQEYEKLESIFAEIKQFQKENHFTNPRVMTDYYLLAATIEERKGEFENATKQFKKFDSADRKRDSLAHQNDVIQVQEKYLLDKEISELNLLQRTNELQASHLKLRTALLIIIAIALIVVLWYVFTLRSKNKKIDRLNEMLEAKVSERTARLMEINKELDTYLYRASHDIRRPIRTLLGLNNIAQINTDPEQMRQLFGKVHSTAMSMDKMLFKLQMAYELNNTHHIEKVDIDKLTKECISDMALEIKEQDAKITVNIDKNATSVQANEALLRIALDNIIENALLYQREEHNEIEIYTDIGNYFFYIHVKDNGFGIPEKYFDDLFKPYFKISNKTQGSGLGLFLAHKAISFLAGEISVSSIVNKGSQFTLKIPINPK
jgi:signal transduction histidine kinase